MKNNYIHMHIFQHQKMHMHIFQHQKMHTATSDMQDEQATSGY